MVPGSSPRVWGEARRPARQTHARRIIPTRVGRRATHTHDGALRPDHPHACGEKSHSGDPAAASVGSSPRVWGEGEGSIPRNSLERIIPTRVGRSFWRISAVEIKKDHPHACGEKKTAYATKEKGLGSSPRVWGEEMQTSSRSCAARIIPTRVGRRSAARNQFHEIADHPHACGEKLFLPLIGTLAVGSSPRVWGEACAPRPKPSSNRIIPTRVGRSCS